MKRILTAEQMQKADQAAMEQGLPSLVLMERAAVAVTEEILASGYDLGRVCIVCGTGNNAGDGVAIARVLQDYGYHPEIYPAGDPAKYSPQMTCQMTVALGRGIPCLETFDPSAYTLVVDALFGIGLHRPVTGAYAELIRAINASDCKVVSVDIPSGVHTDTGQILGDAIRADLTVTFARGKIGHYLFPGAACTGRLVIRQISIPVDDMSREEPPLWTLEEEDLKRIPPRDEAGNKGTFGKLLVIAGSRDICGAAYLAARASLMTGLGMVKIYTSAGNRTPLATLLPEALLSTYQEEDWDPRDLERELDWADGVLIGPGLGVSQFSRRLLEHFLAINHLPCLIDADALNLLAQEPEGWSRIHSPCIITPHIAEMSRIAGKSVQQIKANPLAEARAFARRHQVTCVLKDARTVIALPDETCFLNHSGNSTLATAGSGDALAGICAGLMLQYPHLSLPPAALAVYIHGLCGERAGERYSRSSATARDILEAIPLYL